MFSVTSGISLLQDIGSTCNLFSVDLTGFENLSGTRSDEAIAHSRQTKSCIVLYFRKKRIEIKHQRMIEAAYPLHGRGWGGLKTQNEVKMLI